MGKIWSDAAVRNLSNWAACPRCDWSPLNNGWCPNCGADLTSAVAVELAAASRTAVEALQARQEVLDRLPSADHAVSIAAHAAAPRSPAVVPSSAVARVAPEAQVSVQSVLAVAGAGLVAVAAIVFTFFTGDLSDAVRSLVVAAISVVFLGAAWLLARARLQFSAEAVGALAMVFVVLDVWAVSTTPSDGVADFAVAAVATAIAAAVMIGLGSIRRLRTWLWSGLVGLSITPLLFGLAVDGAWSIALGWLGVGFVAVAAHELARALAGRQGSALRFDHGTLTALQLISVAAVLWAIPGLPSQSSAERVLSIGALFAGLAALSALGARHGLRGLWSFAAGAFVTTAVGVLPLAAQLVADEWLLTLVPLAAGGTLALVATVSLIRPGGAKPVVSRNALLGGSIAVSAVAIAPAGVVALAQAAAVTEQIFAPSVSLAAILGGTALALALLVVAIARRSTVFGTIALCIALVALVCLASWTGITELWRVVASLLAAVALVPVLVSTPVLRSAGRRFRLPLFVAAHILVIEAAAFTTTDVPLGIYGGVAVTVAIAAIAVAVPRVAKPAYAAAAFTYGLLVFAFSLANTTTITDTVIVALTATLALLVAIAVTVVRVIPRDFWYAALIVAAVPSAMSVGSLLLVINGWVGLCTAVALVLLVVMTLLHRDGHSRELRAGAAALIVPTLAVGVISVVADIARASASPITLPIVAGLVAITLPTTGLVGRLLERRGHSERDAAAVRLMLEISALVTGSIAVLLTLLRSAAGPGTTFLVLVIVGIGAAATGQFVRRRYAWYVAFISFTGALWALLALNSVSEIEPYILPPAFASAAIGAVAVARGRRGLGFYAAGLAVAGATPLIVLARSGNGAGAIETRAYALLAAAVVLTVVGLLLGRGRARGWRLARLRSATLFVGLGTASAGVVQAARYGFGLDLSVYGRGELVMVVGLLFSALACAIAAAAALLLARSPRLAASRWLYVPAMAYLVAGPITAFRHGDGVYSWTLLVLMTALLAVMVLTVARALTRTVTLPPVVVTFTIATITGIAGWSEHGHFRVEAYSLPLGAALLAAGVIAWRSEGGDARSLVRWPIGFHGSWWLLAPGITVALANSLMSTLTDPVTWRAILVIVIALVAILLGNRLRLAAPFFLGVAALPLEILFVFAVQASEKIQPTTWWITLASAGALLLVLAVSSERRATGEGGVAARLRDLR